MQRTCVRCKRDVLILPTDVPGTHKGRPAACYRARLRYAIWASCRRHPDVTEMPDVRLPALPPYRLTDVQTAYYRRLSLILTASSVRRVGFVGRTSLVRTADVRGTAPARPGHVGSRDVPGTSSKKQVSTLYARRASPGRPRPADAPATSAAVQRRVTCAVLGGDSLQPPAA